MRDFIAKFVENYVSVPDLVIGLLVTAIGGIATLILRAIWKWIKSLQQDKRKLRSVLQYVTLFIAFTVEMHAFENGHEVELKPDIPPSCEPLDYEELINAKFMKTKRRFVIMICPNCGSENVTISMQQVSSKTKKSGVGFGGHMNNAARGLTAMCTLGLSNLVWKKSTGTAKEVVKNQKMCLCQNCGNSWPIK